MMRFSLLSRTKVKERCAVCKRDLPKFKYKPRSGWNIYGYLCGDCHVRKTMEYSVQHESRYDKERQETNEEKNELAFLECGLCSTEFTSEADLLRPKWQWNMEMGLKLCKQCYAVRNSEYERRINFCALCGKKLSFFRYNPKPKWKMEGQLCRSCWDSSNTQWKRQG